MKRTLNRSAAFQAACRQDASGTEVEWFWLEVSAMQGFLEGPEGGNLRANSRLLRTS